MPMGGDSGEEADILGFRDQRGSFLHRLFQLGQHLQYPKTGALKQ